MWGRGETGRSDCLEQMEGPPAINEHPSLLSFTDCVTLGKLLQLSEPHIKNKENPASLSVL